MNITYPNVQNLRNLTIPMYHYINENEDTLATAFLKGYLCADRELRSYMSQYLWQYFGIDPSKNALERQIDHYAFERGLDWDRGFMSLIIHIIDSAHRSEDLYHDIIETLPELVYKPIYVYEGNEEPIRENIDISCKSIQLKNGTNIEVGSVIQLCDKIGDDYKKTKFYDGTLRNPSWELFYPSEKDFEYVFFYYEGDENTTSFNFGRVRRLFSDSISRIKYISVHEGVVYIYTDLFKIEIEKALEVQEVKILDTAQDLTDFSFFISRFKEDCHKIMPKILEFIDFWCYFDFFRFKKTWQRYNSSITGNWFKRT